MSRRDVVQRYRRHADLYGVVGVYEAAAADGLVALELAGLALYLRRVDPGWRLSRGQRIGLLVRLEGERLADKRVREYLGVGQDTLRRMRKTAFLSTGSAAKSSPSPNGAGTPVLPSPAGSGGAAR